LKRKAGRIYPVFVPDEEFEAKIAHLSPEGRLSLAEHFARRSEYLNLSAKILKRSGSIVLAQRRRLN